MTFQDIFMKAEDSQDEVVKICSELVQFNSAHPEGRTDECVSYIEKYLNAHNIDNEIHVKEPEKPNIVARVGGSSHTKTLWVGHLDVVPEGKIENWLYAPYGGIIEEGRVYGRGSSDMKGGCAAALVSARILNETDDLENTVEFWFTSDEEIGGTAGARWLAETDRLKGDVCIIGDGNGGGLQNPSIDMGCKGSMRTILIAKGKTAHGSTPYLVENAIKKLMEGIPWVDKIGEYELELPDELDDPIKSSLEYYMNIQNLTQEQKKAAKRLFNYPTVTCNIINGGVKINVVPDHATAEFDIRLTPGTQIHKVRRHLEELVEKSGIKGIETEPRKKESMKETETAGYYESPNSNFANKLRETIEEATGKDPSLKILTGGTDGISTSKIAGIPSLGYGTSLTGQAHQPNEYITIENLVLGVKIYSAFPLNYRTRE
jgi:succinyl-diaminopimelate desuccinylase